MSLFIFNDFVVWSGHSIKNKQKNLDFMTKKTAFRATSFFKVFVTDLRPQNSVPALSSKGQIYDSGNLSLCNWESS